MKTDFLNHYALDASAGREPRQILAVRRVRRAWITGASLLVFALAGSSLAFERYKDPATGTNNCSTCHGNFTDGTSRKGSTFPNGGKHTMHRSSSYMNTFCPLCHTSGDDHNPYLASSDGVPGQVTGLGCSGCHVGVGLRRHHAAHNVLFCGGCHTNDVNLVVPPEHVDPPYYGTAYALGYTLAHNACNDVAVANTNENWSLGDFVGLDNDGNDVYDRLDPACSPYRVVSVHREGNDFRVTWETTGGRTDVLQAAAGVAGLYTDVTAPILIPGTVVITTNLVDMGGATNGPARFYRLRLIP